MKILLLFFILLISGCTKLVYVDNYCKLYSVPVPDDNFKMLSQENIDILYRNKFIYKEKCL